jgi:hypothetical protein
VSRRCSQWGGRMNREVSPFFLDFSSQSVRPSLALSFM